MANLSLYHEYQVETVLLECGLEIVGDTRHDFQCYCPYHGNKFTPSFNVSKTKGSFVCFNPACGVAGDLVSLVKNTLKKNDFEAMRMIARHKKVSSGQFKSLLMETIDKPPTFTPFPQEVLDRMYDQFWEYYPAYEYMMNRGFEEETLRFFRIGYSAKQDLITVPMHDPNGMPIGVVGRSIKDKRFKNSPGLPKNKVPWNFHRAKAYGTFIVTEASFDSGLIHQDGYPNTGALLGGSLSKWHVNLMDRHFDTIILFVDNDEAGRKLGDAIVEQLPRKRIKWASYDDGMVFPEGVKDAGDMTSEQRIQCIKNSVGTFEYRSWNMIQLYDGQEYKVQK